MSAGRSPVGIALAIAGILEFILRIALVSVCCLTLFPIIFIGVILEPDMDEVREFTYPYAWRVLNNLIAKYPTAEAPGELSRKQRRELAFQRLKHEQEIQHLERQRVLTAQIRADEDYVLNRKQPPVTD